MRFPAQDATGGWVMLLGLIFSGGFPLHEFYYLILPGVGFSGGL